MLERDGLTVFLAHQGKQGFTMFQENGENYFDAILTDLRMPVLSGKGMLLQIRRFEKLHKWGKIPVIIITGIFKQIQLCANFYNLR